MAASTSVFVSSLLPQRHPRVLNALRSTFAGRLQFIPNTADIWCRDYMPVGVAPDRFVQFRYAPRYLQGAPLLRTPDAYRLLNLDVRRSPLAVDGGNVVRSGSTAILTAGIYRDNTHLLRPALTERLREVLEVTRLIVIPVEPGDRIGHADGVVRLIDNRTALLNDYRHAAPAYGRHVEALLRRNGLETFRCPYMPSNAIGADGIPSASGVYVNFLKTPDLIACPVYGLPADEQAIRVIDGCFPRHRVVPIRCDGPAAEGGALNCLTWNLDGGDIEPVSAVYLHRPMKFIVADRQSVESGLLVRSAYVLISIRDPDKGPVRVPKQSGLRAVLSLAFHDAEPTAKMPLPVGIKLMTEEQAKEIWLFARLHAADVGTIVVHCEQGMSRSPAVAAALCRGLGGDDRRFWREYQPNRYIHDMMCSTMQQKE